MEQPKQITQTNKIDPMLKPYVQFGLSEAQRLYGQAPEYYPGQTYVSPSTATQQSMLALQNRALQGSALNPAAQQQQLATIRGDFLAANNPYLSAAMQGVTQTATQGYNQAVNQALSGASRAGRFGSGAMNTALSSAGNVLANQLSNTAGQMAFQNYAQERARQEAAALNAPAMAQADYFDIAQLAQAGQMGESYQQAALQDAINRFNFQQNLPQNQLNQFLSQVYGAPRGSQVSSPVFRNTGGSLLGGAATGAAIGNAIPGVGPLIGAGVGGLLGLL